MRALHVSSHRDLTEIVGMGNKKRNRDHGNHVNLGTGGGAEYNAPIKNRSVITVVSSIVFVAFSIPLDIIVRLSRSDRSQAHRK